METYLYTVNLHWSRAVTAGFETARVCFQILIDIMFKGLDYIIYISLHFKANGCSKEFSVQGSIV